MVRTICASTYAVCTGGTTTYLYDQTEHGRPVLQVAGTLGETLIRTINWYLGYLAVKGCTTRPGVPEPLKS